MIVLLPKSLSVGTPEMTPVWASMVRPAGNDAREGQIIARGGSREMAGDVEREGLAFVGALVRNRGFGRAAVVDLELEALADRHAVSIGRRHRDQRCCRSRCRSARRK